MTREGTFHLPPSFKGTFSLARSLHARCAPPLLRPVCCDTGRAMSRLQSLPLHSLAAHDHAAAPPRPPWREEDAAASGSPQCAAEEQGPSLELNRRARAGAAGRPPLTSRRNPGRSCWSAAASPPATAPSCTSAASGTRRVAGAVRQRPAPRGRVAARPPLCARPAARPVWRLCREPDASAARRGRLRCVPGAALRGMRPPVGFCPSPPAPPQFVAIKVLPAERVTLRDYDAFLREARSSGAGCAARADARTRRASSPPRRTPTSCAWWACAARRRTCASVRGGDTASRACASRTD